MLAPALRGVEECGEAFHCLGGGDGRRVGLKAEEDTSGLILDREGLPPRAAEEEVRREQGTCKFPAGVGVQTSYRCEEEELAATGGPLDLNLQPSRYREAADRVLVENQGAKPRRGAQGREELGLGHGVNGVEILRWKR